MYPCIEDSNSKKLMTEYEKYQELQARSLKLQEVILTSLLHTPLQHTLFTDHRSVRLNIHVHVHVSDRSMRSV